MQVLKLILVLLTNSLFMTLLPQTNPDCIEKHITIVIPSYNNKQWYERNLQSVITQNYTHFNAIYMDDCSPDGTGELVKKYLEDNDHEKKVSLIINPIRREALYNLYTMIHMSDDESIIVTLDGDDWLSDENVLNRLNAVYSANDVWLTYGQFQMHPSGSRGWATSMPDYIVEKNAFRDFQHLPTHLRTFYSWLFKKIKLEDLLYLGEFYPMTWDMAMMFPMIEMAAERHQFIPKIMYIYNEENNISDHNISRQLQAHLAQIIKKKKRYSRLISKPVFSKIDNNKEMNNPIADVIIFAENPEQTRQFLESLHTYVKCINDIFVIYRLSSSEDIEAYDALELYSDNVKCYRIDENKNNFHLIMSYIYQNLTHDYILFTKGNVLFKKSLDLRTCVAALKNTSAYAFYFKLNAENYLNNSYHFPLVECAQNIFTWNFSLARDKWSCANSFDLVLHQKTDSLAQILSGNCGSTPQGLENAWANEGSLDRLGLCFNENYISYIE